MLQATFADQVSARIADLTPCRAQGGAAPPRHRAGRGAELGGRDRRGAGHERRHRRPHRQGAGLPRARRPAAHARGHGRATAARATVAPDARGDAARRVADRVHHPPPVRRGSARSARPASGVPAGRRHPVGERARRLAGRGPVGSCRRATRNSCAGVSVTRAWRWSKPARRSPTSCWRCGPTMSSSSWRTGACNRTSRCCSIAPTRCAARSS